jgi:hypothetical protein
MEAILRTQEEARYNDVEGADVTSWLKKSQHSI